MRLARSAAWLSSQLGSRRSRWGALAESMAASLARQPLVAPTFFDIVGLTND
jgi:hypothetical protein